MLQGSHLSSSQASEDMPGGAPCRVPSAEEMLGSLLLAELHPAQLAVKGQDLDGAGDNSCDEAAAPIQELGGEEEDDGRQLEAAEAAAAAPAPPLPPPQLPQRLA